MMDDDVRVFLFWIAMNIEHRICLYLIWKHVEEFALNTQIRYYLIRLAIKFDFIADFRIPTPFAPF